MPISNEIAMPSALSFALIGSESILVACASRLLARGHRVAGVVSDCPTVCAWAAAQGLRRLAPSEDAAAWLAGEPVDVLLSIVNHRITPAAVLAAARLGAFNFHDSLLPAHAGFNATAWALLEGQTVHGVTWHAMTSEADQGAALVQQPVPVTDDDTAYTLAVKCGEAAVASFATLLDGIERGALQPLPATRSASFHRRSERPGIGHLDLTRSAAQLHAHVRALTFGALDNWMCLPKLALPGGWVVVRESQCLAAGNAAPGTVLALGEASLTLAVAGGAVQFSGLTTADGEAVSAVQLGLRYRVTLGAPGPAPAAAELAALAAFDQCVTGHERFWVQRLRALHRPTLAELRPSPGTAAAQWLRRPLPGAAQSLPLPRRRAAALAALAGYLARVDDSPAFNIALHVDVPAPARPLYATTVPLTCAADRHAAFADWCDAMEAEVTAVAPRGTYARDVTRRYQALRERGSADALPVGVQWLAALPAASGLAAAADAPGSPALTLCIADEGADYALRFDPDALAPGAASALAERFERLLAAGLAAPHTPLALLDLLPPPERDRLLHTWQGAQRELPAGACVHTLFEAQAQRTPQATALVFGDDSLSYAALDQRAGALAQQLAAAGAGPGRRVGLCAERSIGMVVGLLAILKAGAAYVPLDPAYPAERLAMMLDDAALAALVTQLHLAARLPQRPLPRLIVDAAGHAAEAPAGLAASTPPASGVTPDDLAYVIFTSGSTGRPKGVMVRHRNVVNFFTAMDEALGHSTPGVWLAVTSISFDISVLEIFWTLTRGFKVVIQPEGDAASLTLAAAGTGTATGHATAAHPMDFGLFYFSADASSAAPGSAYRLLLDGARFADANGFTSVWTPERHFHAFGGLYPNPAVTTAALATITQRVQLRAGSIVLPLHDPLRVAEDWSVIDNLSGGRVGLSFASGWHVNDFAFQPGNYERRKEVMLESIATVLKLWRGEKVSVINGAGQPIEVGVLPRPVQATPPMWLASAGSVDTFELAGRLGVNVLTNMLGQNLDDLRTKFAAYRAARRAAGHAGEGSIAVMLHTFVCDDTQRARELARKPFSRYLASSFDLVKVAPWMFPAFKRPSLEAAQSPAFDVSAFTPEDLDALLDHAFERYFDTAGLFGTPERALEMVNALKAIGANEVACLIDFGIDPDEVLASLPHLDRLRRLANSGTALRAGEPAPEAAGAAAANLSIAEQIERHGVTHLQCTPSMARVLAHDPQALASLAGLQRLLLGGEALPPDLAALLAPAVGGRVLNMYGPTETTVWSTCDEVDKRGGPITIGRPIANTTIRIVDARGQLVPPGTPGELCIGGAGVVAGYLGRPDLTAERFIADPRAPGQQLYRTGDLARHLPDGRVEFLGRLDNQVKVNGYRIELGEIEAVLARHPAVRQCVVAAHTAGGRTQLVGYVVAKGDGGAPPAESDEGQGVARWEGLWDAAYRAAPVDADAESTPNAAEPASAAADPRFNTAGWNSSYDGEPIPRPQMRAWLDATLQRILALRPTRVLEIGCGTGMLLYGLLPHVAHYTAVDLSAHALETIRGELGEAERAKVSLLQRPAHGLNGLDELGKGGFDVVVINSVAQYFPDAGYLTRVLKRAGELLADGGRVFLGDVRSLEQLSAFQTMVELRRAAPDTPAATLAQRIEHRVRQEGELLLAQAYFEALKHEWPRLQQVDVQLKRGHDRNEMSCFRCDVVLQVGTAAPVVTPAASPPAAPPHRAARLNSLADVAALLRTAPAQLLLEDLPNARLAALARARAALDTDPQAPARTLQALLDSDAPGIDPEALYTLDQRYEAHTRWARSGDGWRFDALLARHGEAPAWPVDAMVSGPPANTPARWAGEDALPEALRSHVRDTLPAYMQPAVYVVLPALPLTPNGKIDRKALPAPVPAAARVAAAYVAPSGEIEATIAGVWRSLLQVEQVGRSDNIFDLGANSLLVAEASSRLSALLGRKLPLVSLFRFPTVEALATHLGGHAEAPAAAAERAQARDDRRKDAASRRRQLRAEQAPG